MQYTHLFSRIAGPIVLTLVAAWLQPVWAAPSPDDYATQLKRLKARIYRIQVRIDQDLKQRDATRVELDRLERQIGDINQRLHEIRLQRELRKQRIEELHRTAARERQTLQAQTDQLGRLAYATYLTGRQSYLKMLLNQQDPSTLGRAMAYYRYLAGAKTRAIDELNQTLVSIEATELKLSEEQEALQVLEESQVTNRQTLKQRGLERSRLITALNRRITARGEELAGLKKNEQRLNRLLKELVEVLKDVPSGLSEDIPFGRMQGQLRLPIRAPISARYNQPKNGNLRWNGIFFSAREDQIVQVIHHGRVAFADWLRGFGLLLIVDHGDGYMSLYSHNKVLYKQVGDWVKTGEPIASVGASGGLDQPGLYFEIRHNGEPRNPLYWCKIN